MNFAQCFAQLVDGQHEGGALSTDRNDRGNWTGGQVGLGLFKGSKFGISAAQYPNEDIANLTPERAKELYLRDYWGPAGCDALPDGLHFDMFDMAANSGPRNALKTLQRAVGEAVDGVLGPRTLQAVQSMPVARVVSRFNGARLMFLTDAPGWVYEGRGWARRIAANLLQA